MATGFQFKRFFIAHDRCAMKVNTDGILLGAIANIDRAKRILDLGTGTGLIAIMLAQRTACQSRITALELEENAVQQAAVNICNSPWHDQIELIHTDVMNTELPSHFDLIVSNPPYFPHSPAARTKERDLARRTASGHLAWLAQSKKWLTPQGIISFILPVEAAQTLIAQAPNIGLHCIECWHIQTKIGKAPKRMIVSFGFNPQPYPINTLTIYQADNQYTAEFKALTQAFYLNFGAEAV